MQNQRNVLASKYLSVPEAGTKSGTEIERKPEKVNEGYLGCLGNDLSGFVAVGVYYCSAIDQFGEWDSGLVDPLRDPIGRTWRLLTAEYVEWMARTIVEAFGNPQVNDADLSRAILKFYRVRDRLEEDWRQVHGIVLSTAPVSEMHSDGDQHSPGGAGAGVVAGAAGELAAA